MGRGLVIKRLREVVCLLGGASGQGPVLVVTQMAEA